MESATFKTVKATGDLAVLIIFDAMKSMKRDFSTTMLVTPPDSPFREARTPTLEESASHHCDSQVPRKSTETIHLQLAVNRQPGYRQGNS